ncbi:hypothetical protein M514_21678 [Trichuris suis]|uniref:Integrase catalytic domain-containing protein n=1 Tax=Trichuris suis TaxID=68888 RepID=A0A085N9L8_9BILA|nr:hypothetical protein M514_21678 [Trichuris suis]
MFNHQSGSSGGHLYCGCAFIYWYFIARRGCPSTIVSDNAKTFVGTNALQQKGQLGRFLADWYINWKFRPPGGPDHGGAWERLIAVAKNALSATPCGNSVHDETLLTVFAEVEGLPNGHLLNLSNE